MITIKARCDGFRRAGVAHSATATNWDDGSFTDEQITAIKNEPMLIVEISDESKSKKAKE